MKAASKQITKEQVINVAKDVRDPELGIDIWTLGLVYDLKLKDGNAFITMTLTTPTCPFGPQILDDFRVKLAKIGLKDVEIDLTFDPPWQPSEELREMLGI